jgi:hypothetical protein
MTTPDDHAIPSDPARAPLTVAPPLPKSPSPFAPTAVGNNPTAVGNDPTPRPAPLATGSGPDESDWKDQVTDLVVDTVDGIHDTVTGPIVGAAKAAVYAVLAVMVAVVLLAVAVIITVRALDMLPGQIWIPYSVMGAVLILGGLALWSKRSTPESETASR